MSESATPSTLAFSRSTSIANVGFSATPLNRTWARLGSFAAAARSSSFALRSASYPAPPRSSSSKSKPALVPSPRIGGGLTATIVASLYAAKCAVVRPITAWIAWSFEVRWPQSFKWT